MSLILRPNTAPGQAAAVPARAGAPRDEPAQPQSPSFDEVLVRSLGANLETTEKIAAKPVAATPARRQSLAHKDDPAELANAIAMTLVGLDGSASKTAAGEHRLAGRADQPASLSDGATSEALAPDGAALAGTARRAGLRLASTTAASTAAKAKTLSASPDNPAATLTDTAQAQPSAGLAAASAQLTLALVTETGAAPALAADIGEAARTVPGDAGSANRRHPAIAMTADSTAALAGSMLPLARQAGAEAPAPDAAPAQGTTQRPGLRVAPATTTSRETSAAGTVNARPTSTGLDNGLPVPAVAPQTEPAAASDKPTLAPVAASSAAQQLLADAGQADQSPRSETPSVDGLPPTAATAPLRSLDAPAGPLIAAAATTPLAARTPRQAVTVKTGALSTAPDATLPELGSTPQPALKAGKTTLAGDADDASQPTLPAVSAGAGEPAAPPLATGSFASQALGPDPAAPAADALGTSAPSLLHPLQAASVGTAAHAAANTGEMPNAPRLSPEVGSKEWNQALSQQVLQLGKAGRQVTELQLNPPGLGPMQVTLHLNQHQMQVMFVSAHASVRAAVEAAMPQLRASLADSGISLGQTSVSSESQAHSAFAQQQHGAARQQAYRDHSLPEPAAISTRTLAGARRGGTGRGVDTYA